MTQVSVTEFRNKLAEYLERAEKGEDIVIERHGKGRVRLSGFEPQKPRMTALEVFLAAPPLDEILLERDRTPYVPRPIFDTDESAS